jgi:flagella basal body P-ring formation protein FlgA
MPMRHGLGPAAAFFGTLFWVALTLASAGVAAEEVVLPVPTSVIYPGDIIEDSLLRDRPFFAHTVTRSSVFLERAAVLGKVARRTLIAGQPIPINAVREAFLVNQGKMATVRFESGGLSITGSALALQNGTLGEVVSLRNVESGIVIRGVVGRDGVVRVGAQ